MWSLQTSEVSVASVRCGGKPANLCQVQHEFAGVQWLQSTIEIVRLVPSGDLGHVYCYPLAVNAQTKGDICSNAMFSTIAG